MSKEYTSLGLMSGTSGDGVDASIIKSDGDSNYKVIKDQYFEYNNEIYQKIHNLKEKINETRDLEKFAKDFERLQKILKDCKILKRMTKTAKDIYLSCSRN